MNDAIAFTNWPKVNVEASLSSSTTLDTSGLREVCIIAFPMPRREKLTSITGYEDPNIGIMSDNAVTRMEMRTVFFLPILFISIPVGTEKIRNQKNTSDGSMLACESASERSFCT